MWAGTVAQTGAELNEDNEYNRVWARHQPSIVMAGLDPAIHEFF
jgi:hypothetical protein